jgi:queuosine precursor transporter
MIIVFYVLTVVLANFTTLWLGPSMTIVNAFFLIGLNLVLRDILHYRLTAVQMIGLVGFTGAISFALNPDTGRIAVASLVAFSVSTTADWLVFAKTKGSWFSRSNKSNTVGAIIDSLVFPTIAFGNLMPAIIIGQFAAKAFGGFVWSAILKAPMSKIISVTAILLALTIPCAALDDYSITHFQDLTTMELAHVDNQVDSFVFGDFNCRNHARYGEASLRLRAIGDFYAIGCAEFGPKIEYLYGVGVNLNVRQFGYLKIDYYANRPQLTLAWALPYGRILLDGFIDRTSIVCHAQTQIKYQIRRGWYIGIENVNWNGKFGITGLDENSWNGFLKLHF